MIAVTALRSVAKKVVEVLLTVVRSVIAPVVEKRLVTVPVAV
jgi:hypothetical protein